VFLVTATSRALFYQRVRFQFDEHLQVEPDDIEVILLGSDDTDVGGCPDLPDRAYNGSVQLIVVASELSGGDGDNRVGRCYSYS